MATDDEISLAESYARASAARMAAESDLAVATSHLGGVAETEDSLERSLEEMIPGHEHAENDEDDGDDENEEEMSATVAASICGSPRALDEVATESQGLAFGEYVTEAWTQNDDLGDMLVVANGWVLKLEGVPYTREFSQGIQDWVVEAACFVSRQEMAMQVEAPEHTDFNEQAETARATSETLKQRWLHFRDLVHRVEATKASVPIDVDATA